MRAPPFLSVAAVLTALLLLGPGFLRWDNIREESDFDILRTSFYGRGPLSSTLVLDGSTVLATTADDFICATLDWWPPEKCDYGTCAWDHASLLNLNLSHSELLPAMQALAPFVLRLGGSLQDHIVYQLGDGPCPPISPAPGTRLGFQGGCLPRERWDAINALCLAAGCRIAFGLNALSGRRQVGPVDWEGPWDPTNAAALIHYTAARAYPIHSWQLGNEVAGPGGVAARISAEQYAADARALQGVIAAAYGASARPLLGAADNYFERAWHSAFLRAVGRGVVDVVTRHNYFLGAGVDPQLQQRILDPLYLARDEGDYRAAWETIHQLAPEAELWIGESGGAYNSGHHLLTDAFISGFWYLDQLGLAASHHHSRHCRQTLVGGNYGLLNTSTLQPNPDFYSALLWRRLMGRKVLRVRVAGRASLRAYAHCQRGKQGGVTLLLLNLHRRATQEVELGVEGLGEGRPPESPHPLGRRREEYHLTADHGNLHSQTTVLNGAVVQLADMANLSALAVVRGEEAGPLQVAPRSYAFVALPEAQLAACQDTS